MASSNTVTDTDRGGSADTTKSSTGTSTAKAPATATTVVHERRELKETDIPQKLASAFTTRQKWLILNVIALAQISMNFNASVFGNAVTGLAINFHVPESSIRLGGMMAFLVCYAFGCEAWAPWSEEKGRKWILQASLFLVNIWALMAMFAKTAQTVYAARILGGFCSAGGSVTLGIVADMWNPLEHQFAIAYLVFASVMGSVVGPVAGGFMQQYLAVGWNFRMQLILGVVTQLCHLLLVPETRASIICTTEARKLRAAGTSVFSTEEIHGSKLTFSNICKIWIRPFAMFVTEPIVLWLSLLSGFSDAFIFTCIESFVPVYRQWGFGPAKIGLAFLPIGVGYVIGWGIWILFIKKDRKMRTNKPDLEPESRLYYLLYTAPLLPLGLILFAWPGSLGPTYVHWIAPMLASVLIGIANFAIYGATVDYMVVAYREYSASAVGGNGFARDLLAGISSLYAGALYRNLGTGKAHRFHLGLATSLLAGLAALFTIPVFIFYRYGPQLRARSKFAMTIQREAEEKESEMARQGQHPIGEAL